MDNPSKKTTGVFVNIPSNKTKKLNIMSERSGMTKGVYAKAAVLYALDNGLTFKEVKTVKVVTTNSDEKRP
jgi:hypothetical protein